MTSTAPKTPKNKTQGANNKKVQQTPKENVPWHRYLSDDDIERLGARAKSQAAICMITLDDDEESIEIAHIISREKRIMDFEVRDVSGTMPPEDFILTSLR